MYYVFKNADGKFDVFNKQTQRIYYLGTDSIREAEYAYKFALALELKSSIDIPW